MDPFKNMKDWQKNLDSLFNQNFLHGFESMFHSPSTFPPINVYKTENEVLLLANIPGIDDINNVHVFIDYQTVELKGSINVTYPGFQPLQEEVFKGSFERKITLPFPVKDDKVDAKYQNGLLVLHLHRLIPNSRHRQKISIKKIDD